MYNSTVATKIPEINELIPRRTFPFCYSRSIAFIGKNFPISLEKMIQDKAFYELKSYNFSYFESIDELNKYVKSSNYGISKRRICFGIYFDYN